MRLVLVLLRRTRKLLAPKITFSEVHLCGEASLDRRFPPRSRESNKNRLLERPRASLWFETKNLAQLLSGGMRLCGTVASSVIQRFMSGQWHGRHVSCALLRLTISIIATYCQINVYFRHELRFLAGLRGLLLFSE
jgi:hypothetical protein